MKSPFTKKQCLEAIEIVHESLIEAIEKGYYFEFNINTPVVEVPTRYGSENEPTGERIITIRINEFQKVEYEDETTDNGRLAPDRQDTAQQD
jgi:hypothetical protein